MADHTKGRQPRAIRRYGEALLPFQPGAILHEAIVGAFKARGASFELWLTEQGITPASARAATFGQSRGPKGTALRARLIEAAGEEVVRMAYLMRMRSHMAEIEGAQ